MKRHIPVMLKEVIEYLIPRQGQKFIDCTIGLGGHSRKILERIGPKGKLLGIDQDKESIRETRENLKEFKNQIVLINDNFNNLGHIARENGFDKVEGILFDLGMASWHFDSSNRGFTFSQDEPLDMRLDKFQNADFRMRNNKYENKTAEYIINRYSLKELANILYKYGDIRKNFMIAKRIVEARKDKKIITTFDLKCALQINNPKVLAPIWQAIRIEINHEYENLKLGLNQAIKLLKPEAKLVVISFHSGEDRITKNFLRDNKNKIEILTKKPIIASEEEIKNNPKARSAKLRAAEKILC